MASERDQQDALKWLQGMVADKAINTSEPHECELLGSMIVIRNVTDKETTTMDVDEAVEVVARAKSIQHRDSCDKHTAFQVAYANYLTEFDEDEDYGEL